MKKILTILVAVLMLVPLVLAVGIGANTGGTVTAEPPDNIPLVFTDSTARMWCPNDETWYTTKYINNGVNPGNWSDCFSNHGWEVPLRQNYVFTGEKIKYFLLVYEKNGIEDVSVFGSVRLVLIDGSEREVGACAKVDKLVNNEVIPAAYDAKLADGTPLGKFKAATMAEYECTLIAQSGWIGELDIKAKVTDKDGNVVYADETDHMYFNPAIQLDIDGIVDFGTVTPGGNAYSDTIVLKNVAVPDADGNYGGVLLDMYIAADDYFTDPVNGNAICPIANGIKHNKFSYYATKGSIDSGNNNNTAPGLATKSKLAKLCRAKPDEYTKLPSYSGHVEDMCRIINSHGGDSILAQGAEMSLTFQLNVPKPCVGSFTDGQFRFWGEVI